MPDLTISPYFDTTEAERAKGYQRVLGVPERYIQGRDLTLIQHMVQAQLRDIADTLYRNGSVIEGCQIIIDGTDVKITAGKIYFMGFVITSPETELTITGSGEEIIGINITETIVTEETDSSLRGQVPGSEAYGQPGFHRLKVEANVVVDSNAQIKLYKLLDGVPQLVSTRPEMSELYNILARRTYDESENYLVNGLDVFSQAVGDQIELTIESGKCYVRGYEVTKPYPTKLLRNKCTASKSAIDSYHTVESGVTTFPFGNQPLATVTHVKGNVMVTNGTFYRSSNPSDDLNLPNLVQIHKVHLLDPVTEYVLGEDYTKNGDTITWLGDGPNTPPTVGQAYCVDYTDRKTLIKDTDYEIDVVNDLDCVVLLDSENTQGLVEGSQMEFAYTYYLARKDVIYIDQEGNVLIAEGPPNDINRVPIPQVPDGVLARAEVYMPPNSTDAEVENYDVRRFSMPDLHKVVRRLENIEYNLAIKDLDDPNLYRITPTQLKSMFTDGFVGFTKGNLSHPAWSGGIDPINRVFGCPYASITYTDFDVASATATLKGDGYLLPYTDEVYINQPLASSAYNINPYSVYDRVAIINLNPAFKTYTEDLIIKESTQTITIAQTRMLITRSGPTTTVTNSRLTDSWFENKLLRNEAMEYIPETTVALNGINFFPNQDNLTLYFDGVQINATPTGTTEAGSNPGTVKSKADGSLSLTFTIPTNTFRTGLRKVELKNENQSSETAFTAYGSKNLYERINHRTITRTTTRIVEPLAETFYNTESCYLTKVDLYFKTKDSGSVPAFVQIRNVVNGYPGSEILTHKFITPAEITTSVNGSSATSIVFDTPVFVEADKEYCFVIGSDSDAYEIFVADMGQTDLLTGVPINRQPYFNGTMFSSANAQAWTAHQMSDIKFKLYRAKFNLAPATLTTNEETANYTQFAINAETLLPEVTTLSWYYSQDEGTNWIPFSSIEVASAPTRGAGIQLRAVFNSTNPYLSPYLSKLIQGILFDQDNEGVYISKLTEISTTFNQLKAYLDVYTPLSSGQTATLSISTDNGSTWDDLTPASVTPMAYGWKRNYYEESISPAADSILFKITLTTTNRVQQPLATNLVGIMLTV
jgi:hypothetical protein